VTRPQIVSFQKLETPNLRKITKIFFIHVND
jgi:hypothetical protein